MPTAFGIQAWIEVDGLPLTEYEVDTAEVKSSCYIPSQAGKVTIICLGPHPLLESTDCSLFC